MKRILVLLFLLAGVPSESGAQWVQTNGPPGGNVAALAVSEGRILAAGNRVIGSDDDGDNWVQMDSVPSTPRAFVVNGTNIYVINGNVSRSTDKGESWKPLGWSSVSSLAFSGQTLLAGKFYGGDYPSGSAGYSSDNGTHWKDLLLGNSIEFYDRSTAVTLVAFIGTKLLVSTLPYTHYGSHMSNVDVPGGTYLSTDTGRSWNLVYGDPLNTVVTMGDNVFGGNSSGLLLSSKKGWQHVNSWPSNLAVTALAAIGPNILAGTDHGGIYRSTDSGITWFPTDPKLIPQAINAIAANGQSIFAATGDGLFRSTDDGMNWRSLGITWSTGYGLAIAGSNLLAVNYNNFYLSPDNGETWSYMHKGLRDWVYSSETWQGTWPIEFAAMGTNLIVCTDSGLLHSPDNGLSWKTVMPQSVWGHLSINGEAIYLANAQQVYRSDDSGMTWTTVDTGVGLHLSLSAIAVSGSTIVVGDVYERVFRSTDAGGSWTELSAFGGGVAYDGVRRLFFVGQYLFATDASNVYKYSDSTQSWVRVESSSNCFAVAGDRLFIGQNHGVFLSTDYGSHWTTVNSGLSTLGIGGLAVNGRYLFASTFGAGIWRRLLSETDSSLEKMTYSLSAYPNPLSSSTTIRYTVSSITSVNIVISDALGRTVAVLASDEYKTPGTYELDFHTNGLSPGAYWCRVTSGVGEQAQKLLVAPQ